MTQTELSRTGYGSGDEGDRLSPLDAAFLFFERPNEPLHMGCIAILESGMPLAELFEVLSARLLPLRRFRQRAVRARLDSDAPAWQDDEAFDLRRHVRHVALPSPGDEEQLQHVIETLFSSPLPPDRPPWEIHLIEGLSGGRAVLLCKMHHSMSDGISGLRVLEQIADPRPGAAAPAAEPQAGAETPVATEAASDDAGEHEAGEAIAPPPGGRGLFAGLRAKLGELLTSETVRAGVRAATEAASTLAALAEEPPSALPFHGHLSHSRKMVWRFLPQDEFTSIRVATDATLNDVVLGVLAGALRTYLDEQGVCPDEAHLRAMVPVSVRAQGANPSLGNLVTAMFPRLPIDVADPLDRLQAVRHETRDLKERGQAKATGLVLAALGALPSAFQAGLLRLLPDWPVVDTICTNIPGPKQTLHMSGRRIAEIHPIVPIFQGMGLGFAVATYGDRISICATTDPMLVPDAERVLELVDESLYEIRSALWGRSEALAIAGRLARGPTVAEVMLRDVPTVTARDSLVRARDLMRRGRVRHLPVVDERSRVLGVLTQRDLLAGAIGDDAFQAGTGMERSLAGWATGPKKTKLAFAAPHERVVDVGRRMIEHQLESLPVLDDSGRLIGLVTEEHFLRWTTEQGAARSASQKTR